MNCRLMTAMATNTTTTTTRKTQVKGKEGVARCNYKKRLRFFHFFPIPPSPPLHAVFLNSFFALFPRFTPLIISTCARNGDGKLPT